MSGDDALMVPPSPGGMSNASAQTAPPLDLVPIDDLLTTMRGTLDNLGGVFDTLGEQTARVATLGPALNSAHQIHFFRKELKRQDHRQEDRVQAIKILLRDTLKQQIAEHLQQVVPQMIAQKIQERVTTRVADQIEKQFPMALREQVKQHKAQLAGVKRGLHNSEARRSNAQLRSHQLHEPLRPLLMPTGEVSPNFPIDLAALFAMDENAARQIAIQHELPAQPDDPKEVLLNRFLAHVGANFSMMPPPPRPPFPSLIIA